MEFLDSGTIDVNGLKVSPSNNRTMIPLESVLNELVNSIKASKGIIEPIILNEKYEIVSGQLRTLATRKAGFTTIVFRRFKFDSEFEERSVSMIQDWVRHALTIEDRRNFVQDMIDRKVSVEDAALITGIRPQTIYTWMGHIKTAKSAEYDKSTVEKFADLEPIKKKKVASMEKIKQFSEKPVDLIKAASELPLPELRQIHNEAKSGMVVDLSSRIQSKTEPHESVNIPLPLALNKSVNDIAIRDRKDRIQLMIKFISEGVEKYKS
jgi:transposase-like protein